MALKKPKLRLSCCHDGSQGFYGLYPLSARCLNLRSVNLKQYDAWILLDTCALDYFSLLDTRRFPLLVVSVRDGHPPTREQMDGIIKFIRSFGPEPRILISCIGAHGRTGTVLAIWMHLNQPKGDPVLRVRKEYCRKAVETAEQAKFVYSYLGLKPNRKVLSRLESLERERLFGILGWNDW